MKHKRIFVILAIVCLLIGSAYAVAKLMPAVVDEKKCLGCGDCVERCPIGAIALDKDGLAAIDKEKCTGCLKCAKACPNEAITAE
ncbi:MAG: 4Fe-4S binding protein [Methanothrix sp.]|nr:4Fe-4S binding protein [Methanothrix sp.]